MSKKNFQKITRKTKISNQDLEDIYNQHILDKVFRLKEVIVKTILREGDYREFKRTLVKCLAIKDNKVQLKVIPYQFDPNYRSNSIIEFPLDKVVKSSYSYIEPEIKRLPGCTWCDRYVKVSGIINFEWNSEANEFISSWLSTFIS